jgi:hypothetical protein
MQWATNSSTPLYPTAAAADLARAKRLSSMLTFVLGESPVPSVFLKIAVSF